MNTPPSIQPVSASPADPPEQAPSSQHAPLGSAAAMDPAIKTIQPGGGIVMSIELAWGRLRRQYLRNFRRRYVQRMAESRQGTRGKIPFEPVDPRDTTYYRNQDTHWWA